MIKYFFQADGELTFLGRKVTKLLVGLYTLVIAFMCFMPQSIYPKYKEFSTPGIVQIGRIYLLPTPFNTLVNGHKVESLSDFFWVVLQNASNVFLLYPLVLGLVFLFPSWRNWKVVLCNSFLLSLTIECTQLVLDLLIDAGRVFEIDDLWTNSLGGLLAYWTYIFAMKFLHKKKS